MDLDVARSFLIALLIGALVGIDRERKKAAEPGHSFGGIRTHILLALVGAASARLAVEHVDAMDLRRRAGGRRRRRGRQLRAAEPRARRCARADQRGGGDRRVPARRDGRRRRSRAGGRARRRHLGGAGLQAAAARRGAAARRAGRVRRPEAADRELHRAAAAARHSRSIRGRRSTRTSCGCW